MKAAVLALLCPLCASCSLLEDTLTMPNKEAAVAASEGYMAKGGVSNQLDLGPDQKLLLDEFTALKAAKISLDTRLSELGSANDTLRTTLHHTEEDRDKERRLRGGAEAEVDRLQKMLRERDAKLLSINIEKAKLNQDILLLRIASLQRQVDDMNAAAAAAAAAAPGGGK